MGADDRTGSPPGRNPWLTTALLCAAMLIVPFVVWLLVPSPSAPVRIPPTPRPVALEAAANTAASEPPPAATPRKVDREPGRAETEATPSTPVSGVVLDPDGTPIAHALVRCDDRDKGLTASTDEEGRFQLSPEAANCNAVAIHADQSPSERVRLVAGDRNTLRLSRGGAISGVVVDEGGMPVPSYLLAVESFVPSGDDPSPAPLGRPRSINDPTGEFLFDRLPAGRYVLTASADGRPPARSAAIDVETARTTSRVRIVLPRGAILEGTVLDAETRRPIAGAWVALDAATSTGANSIQGATTGPSGAYALQGVPAGPFSVRVSHESYRAKIVSGLTTRGASMIRQDIELKPRGDGGGESELVGIGAVLNPSPNGVTIASVIDDGPAARAGIQGGDRIVRIDGSDASSMTLSECVQRLRGPEGTRVSIAIERADQGEREFTVTRATIVR